MAFIFLSLSVLNLWLVTQALLVSTFFACRFVLKIVLSCVAISRRHDVDHVCGDITET